MNHTKVSVLVIIVIFSFSFGNKSSFANNIDENMEYSPYQVGNLTYIDIDVTSALTVIEGNQLTISVTVTGNDAVEVSVTLDASLGEFTGESGSIISQVTLNDTFSVVWTSPDVIQDTEVSFIATASAEDITSQATATTLVSAIISDFGASWSLSANSVFQNETVTADLTVTDGNSGIAVIGADVSLLLGAGNFVSNNDVRIVLTTNNLGIVSADISFEAEIFVLDLTPVSISAMITKDDYNALETNATINVKNIPAIPKIEVTTSSLVIEENGNVVITVKATLNDLPWNNATIKVFTNAGGFDDNTTNYSFKTDETGIATATWSSENLPSLTQDITVIITLQLVSFEYSVPDQQFTVSITSVSTSDTLDIPDTNIDDAPLPILWILIPIGALSNIYRRKNN